MNPSAHPPSSFRELTRCTSVFLWALLAAWVCPRPAVAETFDLAVFRYCAPGTHCGHTNDDAFRSRICSSVDEMNFQWRKIGYSFRPEIFATDSTSPSAPIPDLPSDKQKYYQTAGCAESEEDEALRRHWRDAVAASAPQVISMMITRGPNRCCSNIARTYKSDEQLLGIYCDANRESLGSGSVWSHEMGHHWGLVHTFREQDFIDTAPSLPQNDLDADQHDALGPVNDTPPDPNVKEKYREDANGNPIPGLDEDEDGNPIPGHQWCVATAKELDTPWGSHETYCELDCVTQSDTGPLPLPGPWPHPWAAMSYYGSDGKCRGPYWLGDRSGLHEPFSNDSIARIEATRQLVSIRANLPDVCADQGGDTDHDGICDDQDRCPGVADSCQADRDGDDIPDACDTCPDVPGPNDDSDRDGLGDICDDDIDDDGCLNAVDHDPYSAIAIVGSVTAAGCPDRSYAQVGWDGLDSDNDSLKNCEDYDDDDDGIPDTSDACPLVPGNNLFDCLGHTSCGQQTWWDICMLGGACNELLGVLTHAVNPDPTQDLRFQVIDIADQTLFLSPEVGTPLDAAAAIDGLAAGGGVALKSSGSQLQLELRWRESGEVLAVAGIFDGDDIEIDARNAARAPYLSFRPTTAAGRSTLQVAGAFSRRLRTEQQTDQDGDAVPDVADNCVLLANTRQRDTDGDGFGNLCDADLDNDGVVSALDLEQVRRCQGVDLDLTIPFWEPSLDGGEPIDPLPSPEDLDLAAIEESRRCRAADLDSDGMVDRADVARSQALAGQPPGPAGRYGR